MDPYKGQSFGPPNSNTNTNHLTVAIEEENLPLQQS
jgi:hypothetical protein